MEDSDKKQPIEDVQFLTQGEILCRERCSGQDQAPDEQKESGDEDHKNIVLLEDAELGRRYGLAYAESFHYICPKPSILHDYIRRHAVPL
jgi:hypothetical protein